MKGQNPEHIDRIENIEVLRRVYQEIIDEKQCFSLKDMALNGRDLIELGVPKGKEIGNTLNKLLEKVIDDPELNNKDSLSQLVKESIKKNIDSKKEKS